MTADSNHPVPISSRRRFLRRAAFGTLGAGAAALGYAWRIEPHWLEVVRRELPIAALPAELEGRTLVQLSDLHAGPSIDADYLRRALASVASLDPALIVVTGDWISYNAASQIDAATRVLEHLKRPDLGIFGITGNHDYGEGWSNVACADALERRLGDLGMRLLRNASIDVAGLQLVGVEDLWSPPFSEGKTERLSAAAAQRPSLVLCHNPDVCDLPIWGDYRGWILSGHTHGGQCKPPFLSPPILPVRNRRYTAGEFALSGGRKLYIHRGVGYVLRARFNVRPEITAFTLRRAA